MTQHRHQDSILITGCSTGIGLASARTLQARGWRVIATARKPEDVARLRLDVGVEAVPLELSDPQSIDRCADEVLSLTDGKIYALFNNAAYGTIGAMEDTPADVLRQMLEVNVVGPHALTRRLIPAMRRQGRGRIVMCSSVLGIVTAPYRGAYCASKQALEGISDALRLELAAAGIHVSLIEPGPIETSFVPTVIASFRKSIAVDGSPHREVYERRLNEMMGGRNSRFRLGPEAVVKDLIRALESPRPRARYRVGFVTEAAAVAKRMLPTRLVDLIMQRA